MSDPCVFCRIIDGDAPADIVGDWPGCLAFRPLNPVTHGHLLVVPKLHISDALFDPAVTGMVMSRAAELAAKRGRSCNLITSVGPEATQTVRHLHIHIVPRRFGDELPLPWTPQQEAAE